MKLTKFEHACFMVEKDNQSVVVDPGSFTTPLFDVRDVVALVITHEHADHWTPEQLRRILANNPEAQLFAPAGVAAAAGGEFDITVVTDGQSVEVGVFTLTFFGEKHALIHASIPVVDNIGVIINNTVVYPGDAFTIPPIEVDMLAVPASAPWMKTGEMIDYILAVTPKRTFPVHELINSVIGNTMAYDRMRSFTEQGGGEYHFLAAGESFDL